MNILLTGASHGLGQRICQLAEERGHRVFDLPGEVILSGAAAIGAALEKLGEVPDVIINNYGVNHLSWIGSADEEDELIIAANLLGPYWVVNHAKRIWNKPMRVINVASQTHRVAQRCTALYCASKAGLVQLTRVMARELAPYGWVINAVSPGKIEDTRMALLTDAQVMELRGWGEHEAEQYALGYIPMGRFTNRQEIAELVLSVLGLPDYVNGSVIEAHGGA
jgi:NAD(P)-dependent dehydrogenase (short-subunit alcohol dehydrogenase family)